MLGTLINVVVYIIVLGLLLWLLQYIVDNVPMFEPFRQVARIIIMVIGVLGLIFILLSLVGEGGFLPRFSR